MPVQKNNYRREQQPLEITYGRVIPQAPEMEKAVLGALMIDRDAYLEVCDLLRPESFYEPRNQMVYDAIVHLSMEESPVDLAKELDIPVLALSQLNRGVESREGAEGKRPHLSDLRESGAIEQDADMVIFLHRPEYYGLKMSKDGSINYERKAEVIISKHRKGATGIIMMKFEGAYTRFENDDNPSMGNLPPTEGGEIRDSNVNGEDGILFSPEEYDPFKLAAIDGYRGGY